MKSQIDILDTCWSAAEMQTIALKVARSSTAKLASADPVLDRLHISDVEHLPVRLAHGGLEGTKLM